MTFFPYTAATVMFRFSGEWAGWSSYRRTVYH